MIHIRTWIFIPLLVILLIFPIGIYVVFNITSKNYSQQIAEKDLESTLDIVIPIAEELLIDKAEDEAQSSEELQIEQSSQTREFFSRVRTTINQRASGAQLIVTGRDGEITYPDERTVSEETQEVYDYFRNMLEAEPDSIPMETINNVVINDCEYIMYSMEIEVVKRNRYIIAYSQLRDTSMLLAATGRLILIITSIMAVIVTLAAWMISARISKPIERFCKHTRQVSRGRLTHIEDSSKIYELEALRDELNDMSMRLKQYEDDQRAFYQNVAHEIRTPLMSIRGYAEGIGYGAFTDNKEAVQIIISQSIRLSDMAGELLLLSELENAGLSFNLQSIKIIDYLEEQIKLAQGVAFSRDVDIVLNTEKITKDTRIEADDELFAKAVTNVLANCIRYARKLVTVTLEYNGDMLSIRISDDGDGIIPEYIEHIFKRFYKGSDGNTGLGLAIAKAVVESMNGTISADNNSIGGAEFIINMKLLTTRDRQD